jgi:lysozyme
MNDNLHVGKKGIELIKSFESCVLTAYKDTIDSHGNIVYSIGWGHSNALGNPQVTKGMVITQEEADKIFLQDAVIFENKVKKYVTVALNQNQFDALVCMIYNVSTAHFLEMLKLSGLNEGHYDHVSAAMMHYNVSNGRILRGLTRRRTEEGNLFNTPVK